MSAHSEAAAVAAVVGRASSLPFEGFQPSNLAREKVEGEDGLEDHGQDARGGRLEARPTTTARPAPALPTDAPLVWITGAGGLIGSHLARSAAAFAPDRRVAALTRSRLELTDHEAVTRAFEAERPSLVIHCAAMSRSADCEADPTSAEFVNVTVTRQLSELAQAIPFIFFSTDLVFDGRKGGYVETDPCNPMGVYAETKVRAEEIVLGNPRHTVIRTSLNAGTSPRGDKSFTEQMRLAWERGKTLKLFTDEFRSPIAAAVTARAVWELVQRNQPGLYHLAGSERLSRWEIGHLLAEHWPSVKANMERASIKDFTGPRRPADTSLNCARIQALLSFPLPALSAWLRENPKEPV